MIKPMTDKERKAAIQKAAQNKSTRWEEPMPWMDDPKIDNVNNPAHYNTANLECIDAMESMSIGANMHPHEAYCWQNSFKYLWRWPYKNGLEDLKKARWYIDRLISRMEARNDIG